MAAADKHDDHDYVVARQERYIEAWESGSPERIMEFMDPRELSYSNFGAEKEKLSHSAVKDLFAKNKTDFHDVKIKTRSIHGHKNFTAWEWVMTCRAGLGPDGKTLAKEKAPPMKISGCTLMWWNKHDKIIKHHDYTQVKNE